MLHTDAQCKSHHDSATREQTVNKMLFTLMQVLCMHTVATPTMQIHIGVVTVVDHNLFWLACLVTFSLNASRMYIGLGHFLEH